MTTAAIVSAMWPKLSKILIEIGRWLLNVLMEEGPQNVAKLRGRMNSWLQTAEEGAMWPVDPGGVERAIQMIDCAETLRQIIPGIPNAVTYGGGAASAIGLAVLLL